MQIHTQIHTHIHAYTHMHVVDTLVAPNSLHVPKPYSNDRHELLLLQFAAQPSSEPRVMAKVPLSLVRTMPARP